MQRFLPLILIASCTQEKLPTINDILSVDKPSHETCLACHKEVYKEWAQTLHAGAWVNGLFQVSTKNYSKEGCLMCHSTLPIFWGEIKIDKDARPHFRGFVMEDGVNCLTCHGMADGVAASRDIPTAPCNPKKEPRLKSAEFCGVCHNPTHYAYDEWKESRASKAGYTCISCHMAQVDRDTPHGKRKGRSHYMPGGFDEDQVKRAVSIETSFKDGKLKVRLTNHCGHKFPGEVGFRSFVIKVLMFDEKDEELQRIFTTLRRELKGEINWIDNSLKPDEIREIVFDIPGNVARLETRYFFKQFSVQLEETAIQLGEWQAKTK